MNTNAARGWAYAGIALGGVASIAMNVSSTVHQESAVSLGLRIPGAIFWPVAVYIGVEILTRTLWRRTWTHVLARLVLIAPVAGVAAVVSYLHGNHMLKIMGETQVVYTIGPAAIDGLLFGAAFVLLITAGARDETPRTTLAERVANLRHSALAVKDAVAGRTETPVPVAVAELMREVPVPAAEIQAPVPATWTEVGASTQGVSLEPAPAEAPLPRRPIARPDAGPITGEDLGEAVREAYEVKAAVRKTPTKLDTARALKLLPDGTDAEIAETLSVVPKTIQRLRKAVGLIKDTIMTDAEIAAKTGMSVRAVYQLREAIRAEVGL